MRQKDTFLMGWAGKGWPGSSLFPPPRQKIRHMRPTQRLATPASLWYIKYISIFDCFIFSSQFFCWDSWKMYAKFSDDGAFKKSVSFWKRQFMLLLPYLKFTPFSFEEIQCKRKTFSLAVFFCRWYISSETILRYWFSWKVSIKVLSCTSLVPNLSNKSNTN